MKAIAIIPFALVCNTYSPTTGPSRILNTVSEEEADKLAESLQEKLREAYDKRQEAIIAHFVGLSEKIQGFKTLNDIEAFVDETNGKNLPTVDEELYQSVAEVVDAFVDGSNLSDDEKIIEKAVLVTSIVDHMKSQLYSFMDGKGKAISRMIALKALTVGLNLDDDDDATSDSVAADASVSEEPEIAAEPQQD